MAETPPSSAPETPRAPFDSSAFVAALGDGDLYAFSSAISREVSRIPSPLDSREAGNLVRELMARAIRIGLKSVFAVHGQRVAEAGRSWGTFTSGFQRAISHVANRAGVSVAQVYADLGVMSIVLDKVARVASGEMTLEEIEAKDNGTVDTRYIREFLGSHSVGEAT